MIPRASFILVPILASSFTVLLFFCKEVRAQTNPTQPAVQLIPQHQRIEEKALLAKPEDPDSIRALATDVLDYQMRFPRMPAALESTVKERLVRAEIAYRQGSGPGVEEQNIVYLVDFLSEKFGTPGYSKTSPRQVRVLRMSLLRWAPVFMGQGMTRADMHIGDSINATLSPLQSVYLIIHVIDHKIWDADFQLTPAEWEKDQYSKSMERWKTLRETTQSGQSRPQGPIVQTVVRANPKHRQMVDALTQHASSMGLADISVLFDRAFKILGIGQ